MLKYGESYLVTLKDSIVLPDGKWKYSLYGDYKGVYTCEVTEIKYLQVGDVLVDASNVQSLVKTDAVHLGRVVKEYVVDGELVECFVESCIGNAYGKVSV